MSINRVFGNLFSVKSKWPAFLKSKDGGTTIAITVQPNAAKTQIKGIHGDTLKVQLQAPPVDGKANEALIRWLADTLEVKVAQIQILQGPISRKKVLFIEDLDPEAVARKLSPME